MIVYRDAHWVVIDKPTGMATHAPAAGELGVVEWLDLHLDLPTHVVSRLDRGTSGLLLLALDPAASARAQRIHTDGGAVKTYEFLSTADAVDLGLGDRWTCGDPLDGKPAETVFTRLGRFDTGPRLADDPASGLRRRQPLYHYRAQLTHGRRHQIRRHAAAAGLPLLGDTDHGGDHWPRLCLHCCEIRWPEIEADLSAPLPPSLALLTDRDATASDLDLALSVCRDRRGSVLETVTDAYRLVARDEIGGLPVAVDIYGDWFNAIWYADDTSGAEVHDALAPLIDRLLDEPGRRGGVIRTHRLNPHQHHLVGDRQTVGEAPPDHFTVSEHGLLYEIDLTRTQHSGLFLDQRDSRRRIAHLATGARLANLFAYTCSFSVVAVAHGAEVAFSVDVAKPCLGTGKRNFALNGLTDTGRGKFIQQDVRRWLNRQLRRRAEAVDHPALDLLVCDPPVFASSKDGGRFSVQEAWPFLAEAAAGLLAPDGTAVFANNHQGGDSRMYETVLSRWFAEVTDLRPPLDFPTCSPTGLHVRTFLCRKPRSRG